MTHSLCLDPVGSLAGGWPGRVGLVGCVRPAADQDDRPLLDRHAEQQFSFVPAHWVSARTPPRWHSRGYRLEHHRTLLASPRMALAVADLDAAALACSGRGECAAADAGCRPRTITPRHNRAGVGGGCRAQPGGDEDSFCHCDCY